MKNKLSSDTYQFYLLVGLLMSFWFFALSMMTDPNESATPTYFYAIVIGLYLAYVSINQIGRPLVKDPNSMLATLMANTVPITVVILPFFLIHSADKINGTQFILEEGIARIIGYPSLALGLLLLFMCEYKFKKEGDGTLSPVEELNTQKLVTGGLYSYVRNPMIVGILFLILGLALSFMSNRFLAFLPYFFIAKTIWFKYSEEPSMERRFGESYISYKRNVRRWIPRLTAYKE